MREVGPVALFAGVAALAAGCHTDGAAVASPRAANVTEAYLSLLLADDRAALSRGVSEQPAVDDPSAGAVRGTEAFDRFVAERHAWLTARRARLVPGPITHAGGRTVVEAVLRLRHEGREVDLPIAVVGDDAPGGRVRTLRVYHSF